MSNVSEVEDQQGPTCHAADGPCRSTWPCPGLTCQKVESLRLLRGVSQVAVRQRVGLFPGAAVERGQSQVLHKQLLQQQQQQQQQQHESAQEKPSQQVCVLELKWRLEQLHEQ